MSDLRRKPTDVRPPTLVEPPGLSIVVPVFNGATTLGELTARLAAVLPTIATAYELIFVNDGSRDQSWSVIQQLCAEYPFVQGVRLMRNYGQHNALLCGIRAARYELTVTMDDDLQNPPEELPKLLARLTDDVDVVYGTPESEPHGVWRNLASRITKTALRAAMGPDTARTVNAFRLFRTRIRDAFATYQSPLVGIDVLLTWGAGRFTTVKVRYEPRPAGTSNYTFKKLVLLALDMATGFSTLPLRLASIVGLAFTVLGGFVLAYVLVRYIANGGSVPGFPFLASIIAISSGAQLFALGIIGEYLGRTYLSTMERPAYVVRQTTRETQELSSSANGRAERNVFAADLSDAPRQTFPR